MSAPTGSTRSSRVAHRYSTEGPRCGARPRAQRQYLTHPSSRPPFEEPMFRRPPLQYPERPLHHFLQDAADRHPEKIALRFGADVFTYRELDSTGSSFANALLALGFGPGTRVALAVTNRPEWVIAQHGVSLAGGAVVLPNPTWKASEFEHAFSLTKPDLVVADAALAEVLDAAGAPAIRICVDDDPPPGWLSFWDLVYDTPARRPAPLPDA